MDRAWWLAHLAETTAFQGVRYTSCVLGHRGHGIDRVPKPFEHYGNSGAGAIALAHKGGAAKIVLLGYDCQRTAGKSHWHGDHPRGLGNAGSMPKWPKRFAEMAEAFKDVEIVNCSRETALTCFPRGDLSAVLDS